MVVTYQRGGLEFRSSNSMKEVLYMSERIRLEAFATTLKRMNVLVGENNAERDTLDTTLAEMNSAMAVAAEEFKDLSSAIADARCIVKAVIQRDAIRSQLFSTVEDLIVKINEKIAKKKRDEFCTLLKDAVSQYEADINPDEMEEILEQIIVEKNNS